MSAMQLAEAPSATPVATEIVLAVGIVVLLAVPGYVLGVVSARGARDPDGSEQAFLARTALGSVLVHGSLMWWTTPLMLAVRAHGFRPYVAELTGWIFVVCLAMPLLLGNIEAWLSARHPESWIGRLTAVLGIAGANRAANAWSDVVEGRTDAAGYVRVSLRDGRVMWGFFGRRSYASTDSRMHDLYLERAYEPDATGLLVEIEHSRGFWVNGDDIVTIEFFLPPDGETETTRRWWRRRVKAAKEKEVRAMDGGAEQGPDVGEQGPETAELPGQTEQTDLTELTGQTVQTVLTELAEQTATTEVAELTEAAPPAPRQEAEELPPAPPLGKIQGRAGRAVRPSTPQLAVPVPAAGQAAGQPGTPSTTDKQTQEQR